MAKLVTQQHLVSLDIKLLKNLRGVKIGFERDRPLTAILGPNGFGKSTVLHILAASFQPARVKVGKNVVDVQGDDYRFINFFPNSPYGSWDNSALIITHFARREETSGENILDVGKRTQGLWYPQTKGKPEREVHYFGVMNGMPEIERERIWTKVHFHQRRDLNDPQSVAILAKVGQVLNRTYTLSQSNKTRKGRELMGVTFGSAEYSALSMGAGEQRLFRLFKVLEESGDYALILIDELDLLLHTDALHRLLDELHGYATAKKLQIIFTTHRESITNYEFSSYVAVRHLYRSPLPPHQSICFNDTTPDALQRLTGKPHRPLQIWCEDKIAKRIIRKVARQAGLGKYVECTRFGAASNCYTVAAALVLQAEAWEENNAGRNYLATTILVNDGDRVDTPEIQNKLIKAALSGNEGGPGGAGDKRRERALSLIREFKPPTVAKPEEMLHQLVKSVTLTGDAEVDNVINVAVSLQANEEPKTRLQRWTEILGDDWEDSLTRIIDIAARSNGWVNYTAQVREWLSQHYDLIENVTGLSS